MNRTNYFIKGKLLKGSEPQCMVVELSMQYCREMFLDLLLLLLFMCPICEINQFECKVDVQNYEFGWVHYENRVF